MAGLNKRRKKKPNSKWGLGGPFFFLAPTARLDKRRKKKRKIPTMAGLDNVDKRRRKKQKCKMTSVGLEPTPPKRLEP